MDILPIEGVILCKDPYALCEFKALTHFLLDKVH